MNTVWIPWAAWYGDKQHALAFPESWTVSVHAMEDAPDMDSDEIEAVLSSSINWKALAQKANGIKKVAIAIDDLTRPTPAWRLLPPLLTRLQRLGIDQDQIQILMALGAHRVLTRSDLMRKLGRQIVAKIDVRNHSPFSNLVKLGTSSHDVSIEINRLGARFELHTNTFLPLDIS